MRNLVLDEHKARRSSSAIRNDKATSPTIKAHYTYTYDDGDNMLSKVEPFEDTFNDENYTGWTTGGRANANGRPKT